MLIKFDIKCQRVKGISFHPNRPWLLISLHNGSIQLWDYRIKSLLKTFKQHEGPVRSVAFHQTQPLFISGGDDAKIIGWDYKKSKSLFTLTGHHDYIRTVQFHHELPWILSASDDQTLRLWNWQNRQLIAVITGHSHYVMCAEFHPQQDLIISCSLDQTLRLWNFSALKKKYYTQTTTIPNQNVTSNSDIEVVQSLEGHERGINWCSFHKNQNMIISASDDRKIKLWKFTDNRAYEYDSLFGHQNNISCAIFHNNMDVIISNSEDKTLRVWDLNKKILIDTYKVDNDRYWILAQHPTKNLVATGHDTGFNIFNLKRQRIQYQMVGTSLFYISQKLLKLYNFNTKKEQILQNLNYEEQQLLYNVPRRILYNFFDNHKHSILIQYDNKELTYYKYEIYQFKGKLDSDNLQEVQAKKFSYSESTLFTSKGKLLKLLNGQLQSYDYENDNILKTLQLGANIKAIYPGAALGKIIIQLEDSLVYFDLTEKRQINSYTGNEVSTLKRVVTNDTGSNMALIFKKSIIIFTKNFSKLITITERFTIKSAIWTNKNILLYNTNNHLKYSLMNGDKGILKCLDSTIYLLKLQNETLIYINQEANILELQLDISELFFKLALLNKDGKMISSILENNEKLGLSLVSYLYNKNYKGLALKLVQDPKARFSLALDSGNLEVAYNTCKELKDLECFKKLGEEALRQGNHQLVEYAYQNARDIEKLSYLYTITGNINKLQKMVQIAANRNDFQNRFQAATFIGDIEEKIKILAETGQIPLAYMTAILHNLPELAGQLKPALEDNLENIEFDFESEALVPPKPVIINQSLSEQVQHNWPQHNIELEDILATKEEVNQEQQQAEEEEEQMKTELNRELEKQEQLVQKELEKRKKSSNQISEKKWGESDEDDFDIEESENDDDEKSEESIDQAIETAINDAELVEGYDKIAQQYQNSQLIADQVSLGNFEKAFDLLQKQVGVYQFEPYKEIFTNIYLTKNIMVSSLPLTEPLKMPIKTIDYQDEQDLDNYSIINKPFNYITLDLLSQYYEKGCKLTSEYKLQQSIEMFNKILLSAPLIKVNSDEQVEQVHNIIKGCVEYIIALRCELIKTQIKDTDNQKKLELTCIMVMCRVKIDHQLLFLKQAMALAYKLKCFIYSAYFAKKIISLGSVKENMKQEDIEKARKVYKASEKQGKNEISVSFQEAYLYDSSSLNHICTQTLKLINTTNVSKCPLCGSICLDEFDGSICKICNVAKIGQEVLGLKLYK